ncbi:MAG: arylsulfatase [Betaproteobacteria bacterium RIFCSPLOWO2_02_FULL_62_17]|nr:MAG: arylsulfatase [Betaproteobacteria bacterium RIFCSPLOWO2_02_FULL_62_17]
MPRITLIHATALAIDPIREAFARLWPEARTTNLLEDSLSADLAASAGLDAAMIHRFETLARYAEASGADAILFTCSAFGEAIEAASKLVRVPVLKPNEAMLEEALAAGTRIGIVATFQPTIPSMVEELQALAAARGKHIEILPRHVAGAMEALAAGKGEDHDRMIAASLADLVDCDAVLLAQFSMARAAKRARLTLDRPVLTSPDSAVHKLRQLLS